jgi:hypothetical protein
MAVSQRASGILARFQSLVDKMISPDTRSEYYSKIIAFAQDQPILFVCLPIHLQSLLQRCFF